MEHKKRKQQGFLQGAAILVASTVIVKIIGAVFKIPLSNLIGDLGFGYFSSAYDLFLPIYSLSMAGLPVAVSRMVAECIATKKYKESRKVFKIAKIAFLVTGCAGFLIILAAIYPFISITGSGNDSIYSMLAIAPALLFCCIMSSYRGYYEGLRNMYPTAISDVIEALGKLVIGYGLAFLAMKLTSNVAWAAAAAMFGITLGTVFGAVFLHIYYLKKGDSLTREELELSPPSESNRAILKALVAIAVPVVLSSLATNIASMIDVTMVKWQLKNIMTDHADVVRAMYAESIADYNESAKKALSDANIPTFLYGIRSKAYTLYNLMPTITSVLGVGAIPVLTTYWVQKDKLGVRRNIEMVVKTTAVVTMPVGFGMIAMSDEIMELLYKSVASTQIGGPMLVLLGIATIFAGLTIPLTGMLQAIGRQMTPVKNIAVGAVIKIIINYIFVSIPSINIHGAPLGTIGCYAYIFFANFICLVKYSGVMPRLKKTVFIPLLCGVICGAAAWGCNRVVSNLVSSSKITTLISIIFAGVIYIISLIITRCIEKDDIFSLPNGEKLVKVLEKLKIIR